ncbi:MAG: hypothetical protein U0Y68_23775, partial [Blastocatellia bacterium]
MKQQETTEQTKITKQTKYPFRFRLFRSLGWLCLLLLPTWAQVSFQRIVESDREPGNWLTYSGNYQGHRYSS